MKDEASKAKRDKCCVRHPPDLRHPDPRPCRRPAVTVRDGKPYCRDHDPKPAAEAQTALHRVHVASAKAGGC